MYIYIYPKYLSLNAFNHTILTVSSLRDLRVQRKNNKMAILKILACAISKETDHGVDTCIKQLI